MYASRTVCSRCSNQLRLAAANRVAQTARFASQSGGPDSSHHTSRPNNKPGSQQSPFRERPHLAPPPRLADDSALALFNDVVSYSANAGQDVDVAAAALPGLGELEIAGKMNELASREDLSLGERFKLFHAEILPHIKDMSGQAPKRVYLSTTEFLSKVLRSHLYDETRIDPLELSKTYGMIGKWDLDIRADLILNICHGLITRLSSGQIPEDERAALFTELINMWKHVTQLKRMGEMDQEPRFVLPSAKEVLDDIALNETSMYRRIKLPAATRDLASILPPSNLAQFRDLAPALLATLAVLSDSRLATPAIQGEAAPLIKLAGVVLERHDVDKEYINTSFDMHGRRWPKKKRIRQYVVKQWPYVLNMLSQEDAAWPSGEQAVQDPASNLRKISVFHKQLRTAYRSRNTGAIAEIWQNLTTSLQSHPELGNQIRADAQFLDFWVFVWCAVRRPQRLQETLQLMKELRVEPTIKTYTAMMHGWKMCKDGAKIEALWSQLVASGMKLDIFIWTERVSGLIEVGRPQAGIQALAEMVATYKQACKHGQEAHAVKPTIEIVNAAFKGLIRLDPKAANEVLGWAGREGFVPNIRTYNILLRESFRSENPGDVQDLLQSMKTQDIEPDAATFTIILEEVLGRMGDASPSEQVQAVEQVFTDIHTAGLKPNMETYGKMLYAVASLANGSDAAIAAVQAHMRASNFAITPHMVTILIERALTRSPPDIPAVRDLLREHNLANVEQGDQTLWERVMSAFAIAHERDAALKVFDDLKNAGRPVTSLPCLTDLLRMLLAQGDAEEAKRIVGVVLRHKMAVKEDFRERYWRHHFWFLAKDNGLVDKEQAPHLFQR